MIFVGGPGRSGTSFVADNLQNHPSIAGFKELELKLFFELGGLYDLRATLCRDYSPNRATVAIGAFQDVVKQLRNGDFGQRQLSGFTRIDEAFEQFRQSLYPKGFSKPLTYSQFNKLARNMFAEIAASALSEKVNSRLFIEKTPHNLLKIGFLHELFPAARYVHVIRNPKAIAASLQAQEWGPNDLETAAAWVSAYFSAWKCAKQEATRFDLPLLELKIEDVTGAPNSYSAAICSFLEVEQNSGLFAESNTDVLDRWKSKLSGAEMAALDSELGALCVDLGYD